MKFFLIALSLTLPLGAQPPAAIAPAPLHSPEITADRRVTFRIAAPNAKAVTVTIEGSAARDMQRDEKGIWTLTIDSVPPDYYGYSFSVDGSRVSDSANPGLVPNLLNPRSLLHVAGDASLPWEIQDVPHGTVHKHTYSSTIGRDARDLFVYTPPGYDASAATRYPVLYLLHGYSDDADAWTAVGKANIILDNLIANGAARPMIVAMPLGYGAREIVQAGARDEALYRRNTEVFSEMLMDEVVPLVERSYKTATDRSSRAVAGLSMGGFESLHAGLHHLDRFAWLGAFSSGLRDDFAARLDVSANDVNRQLRVFWIACGTEDRLHDVNAQLRSWLTSRGIHHTAIDTPGAHTWMVWRRNLAAFAPLLFR